MMIGRLLYRMSVVTVFVFMLVPIIYVVLSSFNQSAALTFPPSSLTLEWYSKIPEPFWDALGLSLLIATLTAVISTVLGTGLALRIVRWHGSRGRRASLSALCLLPLMVPPLVIGVALLQFGNVVWLWTGMEVVGNTSAIIAGHVIMTLPFVIRTIIASHAHFDAHVEEAALNLGASPRQTFFSITVPALMPGITSGAIFAFLLSLDDVAVALFAGGGDQQTLPVKILSELEFSFTPNIMAISSIMIYGSILLMVVLNRIMGLERLFGFARG